MANSIGWCICAVGAQESANSTSLFVIAASLPLLYVRHRSIAQRSINRSAFSFPLRLRALGSIFLFSHNSYAWTCAQASRNAGAR